MSDIDNVRMVLAIDPGPFKSAYVEWNGALWRHGVEPNHELIKRFYCAEFDEMNVVAIEMVACYGMAVGKEVFDTCVWIGRFAETCIHRSPVLNVKLVYRHEVKMHLCHSTRAKDANVRQALIDKHGPPGTKKAPGKTFGISGHLWSALAIADYVSDTA